MPYVVTIQNVGIAAELKQPSFNFMSQRGFAGAGKSGDPYDSAPVSVSLFSICSRHQRLMPGDVCVFLFGHRLLPPH
jgi:hypothetical protein